MYTYIIKGQVLKVIKFFNNDGVIMWRYTVNGNESEDWYFLKRSAKKDGIEFINENF